MSVLDMFLINNDLIIKGFNEIRGIKKYKIVTDDKGKTICFSYDIPEVTAVIEKYLIDNGFDRTIVKFESKSLKNKSKKLEELIPYKIVLLDMKIVLYKDVVTKAEEYNIKGFSGSTPKFGLNKYETLEKK